MRSRIVAVLSGPANVLVNQQSQKIFLTTLKFGTSAKKTIWTANDILMPMDIHFNVHGWEQGRQLVSGGPMMYTSSQPFGREEITG